MTAQDKQLLRKHLPRGWHAEAKRRFAASAGLISEVKNGNLEHPAILRWLIAKAKSNKRKRERLTSSLRSLKD